MPDSPLEAHLASPGELKARIDAERRGEPFLVYRDGRNEQVIVELGPDVSALTIGRRPVNPVALEWDAEVSRVHATLERAGEEWTIADDGLSRNGTYVCGERITGRRRLRDGDVIAIGGTALAFKAPREPGSSPTRTATGPSLARQLTPAQRRVLVALCRPFRDAAYATPATNRQIADELVVSVDAVKSTLRALFDAFRVDDLPQNQKRASLALRALHSGAITRRDL